MATYDEINGREPAVVYECLGGWTYRVLDLHNDDRISEETYPTEAEAFKAVVAGGHYVARDGNAYLYDEVSANLIPLES